MRRRRLLLLAATLALVGATFSHADAQTPVAAPGANTTASAPPAATLSLQARLFQARSGSLSADVLAPNAPELVNVVARDDPATSGVVTVAIRLADGQVLPSDSRVRLVAREAAAKSPPRRGRLLLDKTVKLGAVSKGGNTHIAFWLSDIGCRAVELTATLGVVPAARLPTIAPVKSTIPFVCSE